MLRITLRRDWLIDCLAIFFLTSILIAPLFKMVYLDRWASIENTFIADGRMQAENLPHRNWQPLWYCGTRADYVYPPGLRYGTAILSKALHTSPARAYHIYIAFFYALGIVGVYVLARIGSGSRVFSALAAMATALVSPSFLFLSNIRNDSVFGAPQRLHVLIDYGEGPHISALSILAFVFAASLLAARRKNPVWLAAAGLAAAAVVTNNFYGLTALVIVFPILAWACFVMQPSRRMLLRFGSIAVLAYGLCAWWLVPSYLRVTSRNLRLVAEVGNLWSVGVLFVAVAAFLAVTWKMPARSKSSYGIFVWGGFGFLTLYILGHVFFHFQVAGDSNRLVPELDLFIILAAVEALRWLWNRQATRVPVLLPRAFVVLVIGMAFWSSKHYLSDAYRVLAEDHNWRDRIEYRTAKWMNDNHPSERAFVPGSIRLWYDVWNNLPQMDGGSQQGMLNPNIVTAQYRILSPDVELARLWMKALAVDIAIVPESNSKEIYHDFPKTVTPLWRTSFPILRNDGEGNLYYRIDRRTPGTVRLVETARVKGVPSIPADYEHAALEAYVNAIEAMPPAANANGRVRATRPNTDAIHVDASLAQGESLLVQENYDPAWRAYDGGKPVHIEKDPIGFMLVQLPAGEHSVDLSFEPTPEIYAGRFLSCLSLLVGIVLFVNGYRSLRTRHQI